MFRTFIIPPGLCMQTIHGDGDAGWVSFENGYQFKLASKIDLDSEHFPSSCVNRFRAGDEEINLALLVAKSLGKYSNSHSSTGWEMFFFWFFWIIRFVTTLLSDEKEKVTCFQKSKGSKCDKLISLGQKGIVTSLHVKPAFFFIFYLSQFQTHLSFAFAADVGNKNNGKTVLEFSVTSLALYFYFLIHRDMSKRCRGFRGSVWISFVFVWSCYNFSSSLQKNMIWQNGF